MKKYTYILLFISLIVLLSGCSSKSTVKPDLTVPTSSIGELPYTIAIDGKKMKNLSVNQDWDMSDLTVDYGDALLLSIKYQLEDDFQNVFIIDNNTSSKKYDYKFYLDNNIKGNCDRIDCKYISKTSVIAFDNNEKELFRKDVRDAFTHDTPSSTLVLGFITGLTLFLASPITMPVIANIRNNELNKNISDSNNRTSADIAKMLAKHSLYIP